MTSVPGPEELSLLNYSHDHEPPVKADEISQAGVCKPLSSP